MPLPAGDVAPAIWGPEWGNQKDGTHRKTYPLLGQSKVFGWNGYRGGRIGHLSFNNTGSAGHADFDSFTHRYDSLLIP